MSDDDTTGAAWFGRSLTRERSVYLDAARIVAELREATP